MKKYAFVSLISICFFNYAHAVELQGTLSLESEAVYEGYAYAAYSMDVSGAPLSVRINSVEIYPLLIAQLPDKSFYQNKWFAGFKIDRPKVGKWVFVITSYFKKKSGSFKLNIAGAENIKQIPANVVSKNLLTDALKIRDSNHDFSNKTRNYAPVVRSSSCARTYTPVIISSSTPVSYTSPVARSSSTPVSRTYSPVVRSSSTSAVHTYSSVVRSSSASVTRQYMPVVRPSNSSYVRPPVRSYYQSGLDTKKKSDIWLPALLPWPPPPPSSQIVLDDYFVNWKQRFKNLGDINKLILKATRSANYQNLHYFGVPGGFASVAQLEQVDKNGIPLDGEARWSIEPIDMKRFSIRAYLEALLAAQPGYYRVVAFVVSSNPFSPSTELAKFSAIQHWGTSGLNSLPEEVSAIPYSEKHNTTVLVYEFLKQETSDEPLTSVPGKHSAVEHLVSTKLLSYLK